MSRADRARLLVGQAKSACDEQPPNFEEAVRLLSDARQIVSYPLDISWVLAWRAIVELKWAAAVHEPGHQRMLVSNARNNCCAARGGLRHARDKDLIAPLHAGIRAVELDIKDLPDVASSLNGDDLAGLMDR